MTIAHAGDLLAARVNAVLKRRFGAASLRAAGSALGLHLVSVEELVLASEWHHALHQGVSSSRVRLASGLTLGDEEPFLIFNRIRQVCLPHFASADEYDRSYAWAEMHALLLSWLYSLGRRVINPPSPLGLSGRQYSRIEALQAAAHAGLAVAHYGFTTEPRSHPCAGEYRLRRLVSQPDMPGGGLVPDDSPVAGGLAMVSSDCALGDEVPITVAGRYRTRPDLPLAEEALGRLQSGGGHPLMELRLAPDCFGAWKLSHLSTFPEHADWPAATVVADYLGELAGLEAMP